MIEICCVTSPTLVYVWTGHQLQDPQPIWSILGRNPPENFLRGMGNLTVCFKSIAKPSGFWSKLDTILPFLYNWWRGRSKKRRCSSRSGRSDWNLLDRSGPHSQVSREHKGTHKWRIFKTGDPKLSHGKQGWEGLNPLALVIHQYHHELFESTLPTLSSTFCPIWWFPERGNHQF